MLNTKKIWSLLVTALVVMGCMAFAGCSSGASSAGAESSGASDGASSEAESSSSAEPASSESSEALAIGETGEGALVVEFTNETGDDITNLAIAPVESADEPTMLMKSSQQVAPTETVAVGADAADGALYNVTVVCGADQYVLHNVNFETLEEATIRLEGDVAYLEVIADGAVTSTLTEEYDLAHPAVVEEEVVEQPVEEAPAAAADETVYYDEPVADQAPAQSEDACVTDIVLR